MCNETSKRAFERKDILDIRFFLILKIGSSLLKIFSVLYLYDIDEFLLDPSHAIREYAAYILKKYRQMDINTYYYNYLA